MKQLLFMTMTVALLSACNSGNQKQAAEPDYAAQSPGASNTKEKNDAATADSTGSSARYHNAASDTQKDWDKKIIKTAEIGLEVKDYTAYNLKLHAGLKAYGAYVASEQENSSAYRLANEIVIKVPVDQFDNLINSFSGDGITALNKKISSEDISGDLVDTKSRMQAKKQVRDRYLELLKQARNMKEVLEVQQEINGIQQEIESAAGRINYLSHQSAYSTVNLNFFQELNGAPPAARGFAFRLVDNFAAGFHALGQIILLLVSVWPLLLGSVFLLLWIRRRRPVRNA